MCSYYLKHELILCQGSNSNYPHKINHATATYTNGRILSCGGVYFNAKIGDQCYIYEKEKGWSQLSKMKQARLGSASIPIDGGMIVTGGLRSCWFQAKGAF